MARRTFWPMLRLASQLSMCEPTQHCTALAGDELCSASKKADPLTFVMLYPCEGSGRATFYEDAGDGYEYLNGFYARRAITCEV